MADPIQADLVQGLVDRQAIADVVLRYCRGIDRLDLELVRDCYHADATDEHGTFTGTRDEYVEWVAGVLTRFTGTMHVVANQLIEFDRATATPTPRTARPTASRTTGVIHPTITAATSPPASATSTASRGATASGASPGGSRCASGRTSSPPSSSG